MKPGQGTFAMHPALWLVLTLVAFAAPAVAQTPDDDFADFRIPEHRSRRGSAALQGSFSRGSSGFGDSQSRNETAFGQLQGSIRSFFDSEPSQHVWSAGAAFLGIRQWARGVADFAGTRNELEQSIRQTAESWALSAEHRRYLGERPLAVSVAAAASGNYAQQWSRVSQRLSTPPTLALARLDDDQNLYLYNASLSIAGGAGRVRDATGVYDAYVLEERLRATGALTRPLSRAARQKIAMLHYTRPEYVAGTDRPDKFFWRDVERVLREDGALRDGGLDAYDVLRVLESTYPGGVVRMRGWFAGPVVVAAHTSVIRRLESRDEFRVYTDGVLTGSSDSRSSSRLDSSDDQILPGLQAEAHRPLGLRTQLDGAARVLFPMLHVEKGLQTQVSGSAAWFLHERWLAAVDALYDRVYQTGDPGRPSADGWTAQYGVTLAYYLQDYLSVQLGLEEQQARSSTSSFSRTGVVNLTLAYGFWRGFDAPGLTDPVRPISYR